MDFVTFIVSRLSSEVLDERMIFSSFLFANGMFHHAKIGPTQTSAKIPSFWHCAVKSLNFALLSGDSLLILLHNLFALLYSSTEVNSYTLYDFVLLQGAMKGGLRDARRIVHGRCPLTGR